jgi:prevent-host-death family protein
VSALEARRRLGELLESVYYRGDEVVIERAGKVMAVIVPAERYEVIARSRETLLQLAEQNWERNKDVPFDQIERDVQAAVAAARKRAARKR